MVGGILAAAQAGNLEVAVEGRLFVFRRLWGERRRMLCCRALPLSLRMRRYHSSLLASVLWTGGFFRMPGLDVVWATEGTG